MSSNGMHIRFISKCQGVTIGDIRFPQLGFLKYLLSDTTLLYIDGEDCHLKNGDTIYFSSGVFRCYSHVFLEDKYKDTIIYRENDTITKFIEFDLKDTVIFEHGDY
jgi:hypothetical protein